MKEMLRHITKELSLVRPIRLISLVGLMGLIGLIGCTNDNEENTTSGKKPVTVVLGTASFLEVNKMPTRSLPDGYTPYSELYPMSDLSHSSIGLILTPDENSVSSNSINFDGTKWIGALDIHYGNTYHIYGFMPSNFAKMATVLPVSGDFANGAVLTIDGLSTLTPADVCVVVGVKRLEEGENAQNVNIRLGEFSYQGGDSNRIYLLLKHLYSGLHFKAHIDTEYAKLRTIKIKKMTLTVLDDVQSEINLRVTLTANSTNTDPTSSISYEGTGTSTHPSIDLYDDEANPFVVPIETPQEFLGCFVPGKCKKFQLTSIYDVYDRKGNLIRPNCEAVNTIDASGFYGINDLKAGDIYTIDLKIQPTYLYVLSDPDLDNPTFVAN
jgi:hypothetical protein